jgi:DNA-binding transcriptional LysR family regulator
LSELDETESKVTAHSARASGLVKINVPVSFGILHLSPLWSDFMAANPKVTVDVTIAA